MGGFIISPLPPVSVKESQNSRAPSLRGRYPASTLSGRRRRTEALASVRRSNWTCGFPASSFHRGASTTQVQGRNQVDQAHESQLAVQVTLREPFPAPT